MSLAHFIEFRISSEFPHENGHQIAENCHKIAIKWSEIGGRSPHFFSAAVPDTAPPSAAASAAPPPAPRWRPAPRCPDATKAPAAVERRSARHGALEI